MSLSFIDITVEASQAVIDSYGASNMLTNGDFESGTSNIVSVDGTSTSPSATGVWEIGYEADYRTEHIHVFDGATSLEWQNDAGAPGTPWMRQVIAVVPAMRGHVIHYTGYIKSSGTSKTASFGFWTEGSGIEDNKPHGFGTAMDGYEDSSERIRLDYDDTDWHFFHVYFRIPNDSTISYIGPMIRPVVSITDTDKVYIDGMNMFMEPVHRSEQWRIELEPVENLIYGYGYGNAFRNENLLPEDTYDYFNVIGVEGNSVGFGISGTSLESDLPGELSDYGYSYCFGYEQAAAFIADTSDAIQVRATVYENNVRQPNIAVHFSSAPGVSVIPSIALTDENGEALVSISLDHEAEQFTTRDVSSPKSQIPFNGFVRIEAEIDKNPRERELIFLIKTETTQLVFDDITSILDIGLYAFQARDESAFGFGGGYGYI